MRKFPKQSPFTMQQRLRCWIGRNVSITASNLSVEPGRLTKVLKSTIIVVQGERFVPLSTNFIIVHNVPRAKRFFKAGVRTTFQASGMFDNIQLVFIGTNFIELQRTGTSMERILIPMNKVEGLFSV